MVLWMVVLILLSVNGALAATRLGLHVTQEEITLWQARRTNNVNGSNGVTFQTIYTNRILSSANSFRTTPSSDGLWNPSWASYPPTKSCFPNSQTPNPGRTNGVDMLAAAFVYMLGGDTTYATPVRSNLLTQAAQASTNFGDGALWCVTNFDATAIEIPGWIIHLIFAYDYVRIGDVLKGGTPILSTADRVAIETWINNAAVYWMAKVDIQVTNNVFPNRLSDNYTCSGNCPGSNGGIVYFGGETTQQFHNTWSNRIANAAQLAGIVANLYQPVITLNANLASHSQRYFREAIQYSTFPNGTNHETYRWNTDGGCSASGIGSAWTHLWWALGPLVAIADHFGRAGDMSLYTFTSSTGLFGTGGTTKGLLTSLNRHAQMQNNTFQAYASTTSTVNPACLINANAEGGHAEDWVSAIANIFYHDSAITTSTSRIMNPTSGCGGTNCFGGAYGVYLDIPFQWGDSPPIDPFSQGGGAAPTNLRVLR